MMKGQGFYGHEITHKLYSLLWLYMVGSIKDTGIEILCN